MSTPTIRVTITEPGNSFGNEEPPMLTREFAAPNEPLTCYPGSGYGRSEKPSPTSTAQQLEGFLRGAGYMLPAFIELDDARTKLATALRDEERAEFLRDQNSTSSAKWKTYAEALEQKIKRAGMRVPKGRP